MPATSHSASDDASLPIENSPPGIHTMPAGMGCAGAPAFAMVGPKPVADASGADRPQLLDATAVSPAMATTAAPLLANRQLRTATLYCYHARTSACRNARTLIGDWPG